ncbi:MAG: hypothetical protein ACHQQ3_11570 [Gemmatimonadales bacterium]
MLAAAVLAILSIAIGVVSLAATHAEAQETAWAPPAPRNLVRNGWAETMMFDGDAAFKTVVRTDSLVVLVRAPRGAEAAPAWARCRVVEDDVYRGLLEVPSRGSEPLRLTA